MKSIAIPIILVAFMFNAAPGLSQNVAGGSGIDPQEEAALMARSKQTTQFFRRFNGEEDKKGRKLRPDQRKYRSQKLRREYIEHAFDNVKFTESSETKLKFTEYVLSTKNPQYLDIYQPNWYAQVNAVFETPSGEETISLVLKREQENGGWKWVLVNVFYAAYSDAFEERPEGEMRKFLQPLSHEIAFMDLRKILAPEKERKHDYAYNSYQPDYLSLFFYDLELGALKFKYVKNLSLHVMQVDGWFFTLKHFERSGFNAGWLIAELQEVSNRDKNSLLNYFDPNLKIGKN